MSICGEEQPDRLVVKGAAKGGVVGQARGYFFEVVVLYLVSKNLFILSCTIRVSHESQTTQKGDYVENCIRGGK